MKSERVSEEMEVTPHLKTVLKNYQHSATKSLQGPRFIRDVTEKDIVEEVFPPPVQQVPILSAADTTCSDLTETILQGETISCFVVGGEMRLCLPQVLNWVLMDFSVNHINQTCDNLLIYCSRCPPEQLNVLKTRAGLPSNATSCGLIRKTDAERLCSVLLHKPSRIQIPKGVFTFGVNHECFGRCSGICVPQLYTSKEAPCIECLECHGAFSPQQFVCHVHQEHQENKTLHWGFDSELWRCYLYVNDDEDEVYSKYLDEMQDLYEGKVPFPPPPPQQVIVDHYGVNNLKRKQIHQNRAELILDDLAIKKYRLDESAVHLTPVYSIPDQVTQIEYLKCQQAYLALPHFQNRSLSAFKPFSQLSKDGRVRHGTLYDQPILQFPEKVVQRVNGDYQPNVALAPSKKRYLRRLKEEEANTNSSEVSSTKENGFHHIKDYKSTVIKHEKDYDVVKTEQKSPDSQNIIDSTVSVVQSTGSLKRYNSEIELSTDTDDSGSEINEKSNLYKIEEITKNIDPTTREKILEVMRQANKDYEAVVAENRIKDDRIAEITNKLSNLENELIELKSLNSKSSPLRETEERIVDDDTIIKTVEVVDENRNDEEVKVEVVSEEKVETTSVVGESDEVSEIKLEIVKTEPE